MDKKKKLSLSGGGISSLRNIAKGVQKEEKENVEVPLEKETPEESPKNIPVMGSSWEQMISKARELKKEQPKTTTVYLAENLKCDLEQLKQIEGLENVSLTAILSAITDVFLEQNLESIKMLLKERKSRF